MTLYKMTENGAVELTAEEVAQKEKDLAAWTDGANEREVQEKKNSRGARDALLAASDWTQANDSPLTTEVKTSWASYRTALRDLPSHSNWPSLEDSDWPTKPS